MNKLVVLAAVIAGLSVPALADDRQPSADTIASTPIADVAAAGASQHGQNVTDSQNIAQTAINVGAVTNTGKVLNSGVTANTTSVSSGQSASIGISAVGAANSATVNSASMTTTAAAAATTTTSSHH